MSVNQFAVHVFTQVRVKVVPVNGETPEEAAKKAVEMLDVVAHELLNNPNPKFSGIEHVEYTESAPSEILVDPLLENGEVDYNNTKWLDSEYQPLLSDDEHYWAITGRIPDRENETMTFLAKSKGDAIEQFAVASYQDVFGADTPAAVKKHRKEVMKSWSEDIFIESAVKSKTKIDLD